MRFANAKNEGAHQLQFQSIQHLFSAVFKEYLSRNCASLTEPLAVWFETQKTGFLAIGSIYSLRDLNVYQMVMLSGKM